MSQHPLLLRVLEALATGRRQSVVRFLLSLSLLAGCSSSGGSQPGQGSPDASPDVPLLGLKTVWVALDGSQAVVLRQHPADPQIPPSPEPEYREMPGIRWEMRSGSEVVARGRLEDPWLLHTDFDEALLPDPKWGRAEGWTEVLVNVPDRTGTLMFFFEGVGDGGLWLQSLTEAGTAEVKVPQSSPAPAHDPQILPGLSMLDHGRCPGRVNILILPDGFRQQELPTFRAAASSFVAELQTVPAFGDNWESINIWTMDVASNDSGIGDPAKGVHRDTAFGVTFGNGVRDPRRCLWPRGKKDSAALDLRARAEAITKAHHVVILGNTTEWGGCAGGHLIVQSRSKGGGQLLAHELGHSLFKLKDEYDYDGCSLDSGHAPNTTRDPKNPPWADLINTSQLPTPSSASLSTIGAFEAAECCKKGVYRPQNKCLMREGNTDFCAVCKREADRVFKALRAQGTAGSGAACASDGGTVTKPGPDAQPLSCFNGGPECPAGKVCSWNGPEKGYCCKAPFTGTEPCFTDEDCAPNICAFGGPPNEFFYCVPPNDPQCP